MAVVGLGFDRHWELLIVICFDHFFVRVFRKKEKIRQSFEAKLTPYDEAMKALERFGKRKASSKK